MDAKSLENIGFADVFRMTLNNRLTGLRSLIEGVDNSKLLEMINDGNGIFGVKSMLKLADDVRYEIEITAVVKRI